MSAIRLVCCLLVFLQAALTGLAHRHCGGGDSHGPTGHGDCGVPHAHVDWFGDECQHEHDGDDCDSDHGAFVIHVSADEASPSPSQIVTDCLPAIAYKPFDTVDSALAIPLLPVRTAHPPGGCPLYLHVCALRC